jgi:putative endonuclease
MKRGELGEQGESLAVQFLESKGYRIRERNWRILEGELDVVAEEGDAIVFVEVKTRRSREFGYPEESITQKKKARLIKAALHYMEDHQLEDVDWRFDLIAIECLSNGEVERIDHIEDIIQGEPGEFI